jgi:HTH-type transcriptional regulator, osmoprotectant uptake regulator
MKMSAKEEFITLMTDNARVNGLDDLFCRIVGILFAEPEEVSLEELSKKTGYSLSAVSTALKIAEQHGFVKRIRKPGSKKAYFYMEKGIAAMFADTLLKKYEHIVLPSKQQLPEIIQKFKSEKSPESKEGLKIAENYYKQILIFDKFFSTMRTQFEAMARK